MDGITVKVVKLGGNALCRVMFQLYRVILRNGYVPYKWNVTGLHLIWFRILCYVLKIYINFYIYRQPRTQ